MSDLDDIIDDYLTDCVETSQPATLEEAAYVLGRVIARASAMAADYVDPVMVKADCEEAIKELERRRYTH